VANVFLSYRRADSAPYAGRICDRLGSVFGPDHVFMDVEDIAPGEDFGKGIDDTIARCQVLVAIIGPRWLETLRERAGEDDFIEREITAALRRDIPVIPVLVGGAAMPQETDLPPALQPLARRHAVTIRDGSFADDVGHLIDGVRGRTASSRRIIWLIVAAGILIAITGAIFLVSRSRAVSVSIDGPWIARMQRQGGRPYNIRLRFSTAGSTLTGAVEYPTGGGAIQRGTIDSGKLSFSTSHVPQFESEPATISFTGEIRGPEIMLTATMPDGGVATGVARRSE
jgi:hypothetical protein